MYWIFVLSLHLFKCGAVKHYANKSYLMRNNHVKMDFDSFDLSYSIFPALEDYQVDAKDVTENEYPWIAKVIHSKTNDYPHACTCSCIDKYIFITSARCLTILRVQYTRVVYNGHKFAVKAFITPTNRTKQSYDDIGFLVVMSEDYNGEWSTVQVYDEKRTDDDYKWFAEFLLKEGNRDHKAVGWAIKKRKNRIKTPKTAFLLSELDVVLGMEICAEIYTSKYRIKGYYVPCYFGCDLDEFRKEKKSPNCSRAHGVEGCAVFNTKWNKLFGITTWGSFYPQHELPWGFSIPNSDNYFKDKECAVKIRNDKTKEEDLKPGYLQTLCPD